MSIKKCFKGNPNSEINTIFTNKLKEGLTEEDAAIAAIQEYSMLLSSKLFKLTGKNIDPVTIDMTRLTEEKEVETEVTEEVTSLFDVVKTFPTFKGKRNRVFNLFKSVLEDPKYYNEMMTSIDNDTFKVGSLSMIESKGKEAYDLYDPIKAMTLKFAYKLGGEGVGMAANSHSDHAISQGRQIIAMLQQGTEGNEFMDEQYSSSFANEADFIAVIDHVNDYKLSKGQALLTDVEMEGLRNIKISGTLSELINAFVDIANEEAYVARANWGTLFNDYGMAMIRAGVHPYKVSAILAQPVMRELTERISTREGVIDNENSNKIETELMDEISTILKKANPDLKDNNYKHITSELSNIQMQQLLEDVKKDDFKSTDIATQVRVLTHYIQTKPSIKKYTNFVLAAKVDANGAGKSIADLVIEMNRLSEGFDFDGVTGLQNVKNKYFDSASKPSLVYTQYQNSVGFMQDFMTANPMIFNGMTVEKLEGLQRIANLSRNNGRLIERASTETILEAYDAYKMSFFAPLSVNDSELTKEELDAQIMALKKDGNFLILNKLLQEEDGSYIIDRAARKDPDTKNALTDSWRVLLVKHPTIGDYLVREAYAQSGFRPGPKQFHQLIPFEWFSSKNYEDHIKGDVEIGDDFARFAMAFDSNSKFFKKFRTEVKESLGVKYSIVPLNEDLGLGTITGSSTFRPPIYAKIGELNAKLSHIITIGGLKHKLAIYGDVNQGRIVDSLLTEQIYKDAKVTMVSMEGVARNTPLMIDLAAELAANKVVQSIGNSEDTALLEDLNCKA